MSIAENIKKINNSLISTPTKLVAVSKTKPVSDILEAYHAGQRIFGENKVQELQDKHPQLPNDIQWHMIGHLQRNKVKYIAPYISLIHGVDTLKLLKEIHKQGEKINRIIPCLLQVHIAQEESKFGFSELEIDELFHHGILPSLKHVKINGFMGMATNTSNENTIRDEFRTLKNIFEKHKNSTLSNVSVTELSMGMSSDYSVAIEEGSTLIRVGSAIFGTRNYH